MKFFYCLLLVSFSFVSCDEFMKDDSEALSEEDRKRLAAMSRVDLEDAFCMLVVESDEETALQMFSDKHNETIDRLNLDSPKIIVAKDNNSGI